MLKWLVRTNPGRLSVVVGLLLVGILAVLYTPQETTAGPVEKNRAVVVMGKALAPEVPQEQVNEVEVLAQTDHIGLLEMCLENFRGSYGDYTCTFIKQERINSHTTPRQIVDVAFRAEPYSVSMMWRNTENGEPLQMPMGDRALYIEGQWNNEMLVRPTSGFLQLLTGGVVRRKPTDPEVMKNTLRPINTFGFERSLENLLEVYRQADEAGDLTTTFGGYAKVADRETIVLKRELPAKDDYPAALTVIYIDLEYLVPICVEGFDWQGERFCTYLFQDIRFNMDLTDDRFTPEAIEMNSP